MSMWILIILVAGGIVGWLASVVMKTGAQTGILANISAGVVGAAVGHWLGGVLGLGAFGTLGRFGLAMLGSVLLILAWRALKVRG
jgi:uncharacterized membrane protein YeaQ/YmgE (transglycosylase-associated protein family)